MHEREESRRCPTSTVEARSSAPARRLFASTRTSRQPAVKLPSDRPFAERPITCINDSSRVPKQFLGWANAYALFPTQNWRERRPDPDIRIDPSDMRWVTYRHDTLPEQIRSMTLEVFIGIVFSELQSKHNPPWLLRARYGASTRTFGAMYCPLCLAEDKAPYFRLAWRLAFNYACPNHLVQYRDACQTCQSPPWPACAVHRHVMEVVDHNDTDLALRKHLSRRFDQFSPLACLWERIPQGTKQCETDLFGSDSRRYRSREPGPRTRFPALPAGAGMTRPAQALIVPSDRRQLGRAKARRRSTS